MEELAGFFAAHPGLDAVLVEGGCFTPVLMHCWGCGLSLRPAVTIIGDGLPERLLGQLPYARFVQCRFRESVFEKAVEVLFTTARQGGGRCRDAAHLAALRGGGIKQEMG